MEIQFGLLEVGEVFWDPFSGEFWKKINQDQASIRSGGDWDGADDFMWDDLVVV